MQDKNNNKHIDTKKYYKIRRILIRNTYKIRHHMHMRKS